MDLFTLDSSLLMDLSPATLSFSLLPIELESCDYYYFFSNISGFDLETVFSSEFASDYANLDSDIINAELNEQRFACAGKPLIACGQPMNILQGKKPFEGH